MFRPNCTAIFRLIFEQVDCTMDNAYNLGELVNCKHYELYSPPVWGARWRSF
jgi:hypothetical protein